MVCSAEAQKFWSPPTQALQVPQVWAYQPRPTVCPGFRCFTAEPTAATVPMTSWPGTKGKPVKPQELSAMDMSLWHRPQELTLMSTCSAPRSPTSYSNAVNGALSPDAA